MEKFAVDLDAVLDEFEFHEDQVNISKKWELDSKVFVIWSTGREAEWSSSPLRHGVLLPHIRNLPRPCDQLSGPRPQQ